MVLINDFVSRIFLSLEGFFHKTTKLDVFEDFVFTYKIKLQTAEKNSSQFSAAVVWLENELQVAIKESLYLSEEDNQWRLYSITQLQNDGNIYCHCVADDNVVVGDGKIEPVIQAGPEKFLKIVDNTVLVTSSQVSEEGVNKIIEIPNDKVSDKVCFKMEMKQRDKTPEQLKTELGVLNINTNELTSCLDNESTQINSLVAQDITTATFSNNSCSNIFKCDNCLRKFRTLVKLTRHSCKKRDRITPVHEVDKNLNVDIAIDNSNALSNDNLLSLSGDDRQSDSPMNNIGARSDLIVGQLSEAMNEEPLSTDGNVNSYMNGDSNLPVYSCMLCCVSFLEKSRWHDHVCKEKEGTVNGKRGLVATKLLLQERHRFICGFCSESYRSLGRIVYHLVRCSTGPYPCEICSNKFATRSELNYHKKKQHKGVESFFCNECGLGFKLRTSLQKHLINRHENLQGDYHCDVTGCDQIFKKKIFLTNHKINEHKMERKYLCQICGNKFCNRCSLSSHIETHSSAKRFSCPVCCRVLKTKEKLTLHVRTHTGEKPYSCTMCSKRFIAKSKLEEHTRRHRGEKRHKCTNCGKLYANGFDLKQHLLKKCTFKSSGVRSQPIQLLEPVVETTVNNEKIQLKNDNTSPNQQLITDNHLQHSNVAVINDDDVDNKKDDDVVSQNTLANGCDTIDNNITSSAQSNVALPSTNSSSGMLIQFDSAGRVIPIQATALHVVDYVPYMNYQSPDPIHLVVPQQALVVTGYEGITY